MYFFPRYFYLAPCNVSNVKKGAPSTLDKSMINFGLLASIISTLDKNFYPRRRLAVPNNYLQDIFAFYNFAHFTAILVHFFQKK